MLPFMKKALISVFRFYLEGFREMKLGKTLWLIILVKLFIMFLVLKIFFFHDFLGSRFKTDFLENRGKRKFSGLGT